MSPSGSTTRTRARRRRSFPRIRRAGSGYSLARMYQRAYFDDMRALRNDSLDVYARASDCIDQVISQIERDLAYV